MEIRGNIAETVRRVMEERGKTLPELSAELDIPLSSMKNYRPSALLLPSGIHMPQRSPLPTISYLVIPK